MWSLRKSSLKDKNLKIVRMVKKKVPWISHLVDDPRVASDLNVQDTVSFKVPRKIFCPACRGSKMLCGKEKCPIVVKFYSFLKVKPLLDKRVEGSSPPGVFVGRFGYPNVYVGPLVPPETGDTSLYDFPEKWFGLPIDSIVDFRMKLIRGNFKVNVKRPEKGGKFLELTREIALSKTPVETELELKDAPKKSFVLDDEVQPLGPSAPMVNLDIGSYRTDHLIEKFYYDTDAKASEAVKELYVRGVPVSRIQKALSVGIFGLRYQRTLVPTRWSITAVDSMISNELIEKIRRFPLVNEYRVYEAEYLDNRFLVIMLPSAWSYESIEAWYPGTLWNPTAENIFMIGDWEGYKGRTTYARMGGCYYAARLSVAEKLVREGRQATVVVLREAHPGYILPVGVWFVRETVRKALGNPPKKFSSLQEVFEYVSSRFKIPLDVWLENSKIFMDLMKQEKITKYMKF